MERISLYSRAIGECITNWHSYKRCISQSKRWLLLLILNRNKIDRIKDNRKYQPKNILEQQSQREGPDIDILFRKRINQWIWFTKTQSYTHFVKFKHFNGHIGHFLHRCNGNNNIPVLHRFPFRPILFALQAIVFNQFSQHNNDATILVPNHAPKIYDRFRKRTWKKVVMWSLE